MGHQPFETWLLEEDQVDAEQRRKLAAHLMICQECLGLQNRLAATSALMKTAGLVSPAPGFTQRWQDKLALRREMEYRRQTRRFFLTVLIGALIAGGGLAALLSLTNFSITDIMVPVATFIAGLFSLAGDARLIMGSLNGPVQVVIWILVSSSICLLIFGWVYALWRISSRGVSKNEKRV